MRIFFILLIFVSCDTNNAGALDPPDAMADSAGVPGTDAAVPSPAPPRSFCFGSAGLGEKVAEMGNLPGSRTITINLGDPVPSSLLNELQDQHVGNKFASRTLFIPAAGFCALGGGVALNGMAILQGNGFWSASNVTIGASGFSTISYQAPISLTPGTSINTITAYYVQSDSFADNHTVSIRSLLLSGVGSAVPATTNPITTSAGGATTFPNLKQLQVTGLPFVILSDTSYWFEFLYAPTSTANPEIFMKFYGIKYTISRL